jgi:hypothetical protein
MNQVNCHRDKWIDFLTRIYVARISKSYACVSIEVREISEKQEMYGLEFATSENLCKKLNGNEKDSVVLSSGSLNLHLSRSVCVCLCAANYCKNIAFIFSSLQILVS